jgi:hypothetical protein
MGLDEPRRSTDIPANQEDVKALKGRLANCEAEMSTMSKLLAVNTQITAETKEVLDAVKAGLRVLGYIGTAAQWAAKLATAVAAIYAAWQLIRHGADSGGPKP